MRFNCTHTFTIEAEDPSDFDEKIKHYRTLVDRASRKLGIGYGASLICGQPAGPTITSASGTNDSLDPVERLFDEH